MMKELRNNLLKRIFGIVLLTIFAIKMCAFSISSFSCTQDASAIEKYATENKEKEEEAFEKSKKKLMLYESPVIDHEHPLWTNHLPVRIHDYRMRIGNPPPRNIPTPPPDFSC